MKTKTINLYSFDELSEDAKKKAHETWKKDNDYPFMEDCLNEYLHEELVENKIVDVNGEYDTVNQVRPKNKAGVLYSLGYSQGDGLCFTGEFTWKKYTIYITHKGRYVHSNSTFIEIQETDNLGFHMDDEHKDVKKFEALYQKICKTLEERGSNFMEEEDSLENFEQICEANEYTFRSDGVMENE